MRVARSIAELDRYRRELGTRPGGLAPPCLSLVPTMGALHAGHRALMDLARGISDVLAVSVFVNPLQFGPDEDYARYPRPLEADLAVCEDVGVDLVFVPSVADLYPPGRQVTVSAGGLGAVLEGASRPGHFDGVLTVVLKLLNLVRPDIAVFGRKDAQQLVCIRRMALDLDLDVDIVGAPIVREPTGLALSSRNRYLNAGERQTALALSAALRAAQGQPTPAASLARARAVLDAAAGLLVDYCVLVHPETLTPVPDSHTGPATLLVAGTVGSTRLIDNADLTFAS